MTATKTENKKPHPLSNAALTAQKAQQHKPMTPPARPGEPIILAAKPATANKAKAEPQKKAALPKVQTPPTPRGGDPNILAGTPGPGPKVGDSAYQTPQEDFVSKHRPLSDSPGTHAGSEAPRAAKGAKRASTGGIQKAIISDRVVWVTQGRNPGKLRPALVMRKTDEEAEGAENSPIDLIAFPDSGKYPNNDHLGNVCHREGVQYSEELTPDTWHWPEDSERLLEKQAKSEALALDQDAAQKAARKRR